MPPDPKPGEAKTEKWGVLRSETVRAETPRSQALDAVVEKLTPDSLNASELLRNLRLPPKVEERLNEHFVAFGMTVEEGTLVDRYSGLERPVTRVHGQNLEVALLHIPKWIVSNASNVGTIMEIQGSIYGRTVRVVSPLCDASALALESMLEDWGTYTDDDRKIDARFIAWSYIRELVDGKYDAAQVFKLALPKVAAGAAAKPAAAAAAEPADAGPKRDGVFISYAGDDDKWLGALQDHLKPLLKNLKAKRPDLDDDKVVFDATKIEPGAKWRQEIETALARAKVGVLLVSKAFLASDFISEHELLPILEAAHGKGLTILWVLLDVANWEDTPIAEFQSVQKPIDPLEGMKKVEREAVLKKLSQRIVAELEEDE